MHAQLITVLKIIYLYNTKHIRISLNIIDILCDYKTIVSYYYVDKPCNVFIVLRFNNMYLK